MRLAFRCLLLLLTITWYFGGSDTPAFQRRRARRRVLELSPPLLNTSKEHLQDVVRRTSARTDRPLILGMQVVGHDVTFAATYGGYVLGIIELERMHKMRYFDLIWAMTFFTSTKVWNGMSDEEILLRLRRGVQLFVAPALAQLCKIASPQMDILVKEPCELVYDVAVIADPGGHLLEDALTHVIKAKEWLYVDHHHAHAAAGWLDSPFYRESSEENEVTLVLSYDAHGNDGTLRMFVAHSGNATLTPLGHAKVGHSLGFGYDLSAQVVRDLGWGTPYGAEPPCPYFENPSCQCAMPGSFMAFAAIGTLREEWRAGARLLLTKGVWDGAMWPSPHGGECDLVFARPFGYVWLRDGAHYFACSGADEDASRQLDRDFAASIQAVFEDAVIAEVKSRMELLGSSKARALVVSGGGAMNVKANSALARHLQLPTHVPPAPGDNGLALGAAWLVAPPPLTTNRQTLQFTGAYLTFGSGSPSGDVRRGPWTQIPRGGVAKLIDEGIPPSPALSFATGGAHHAGNAPLDDAFLRTIAKRLGGMRMKSVEHLATLLLGGAIIGVARGRAEVGPRALGHRSLLSAAHLPAQKKRLNRLKHRRWYRPCAPIVIANDLELLFEPGPDLVHGTPYMSFAPPLRPWVSDVFPGVAHIDGSARPQSVSEEDDPWMYSLLVAVRSGMVAQYKQDRGETKAPPAAGMLINTSLNGKGMPITADALDVLFMFCAPGGDELEYVLLEEKWLFSRSAALRHGLCSTDEQRASANNSSVASHLSRSPDSLPSI